MTSMIYLDGLNSTVYLVSVQQNPNVTILGADMSKLTNDIYYIWRLKSTKQRGVLGGVELRINRATFLYTRWAKSCFMVSRQFHAVINPRIENSLPHNHSLNVFLYITPPKALDSRWIWSKCRNGIVSFGFIHPSIYWVFGSYFLDLVVAAMHYNYSVLGKSLWPDHWTKLDG
jgi:hypothetical protein